MHMHYRFGGELGAVFALVVPSTRRRGGALPLSDCGRFTTGGIEFYIITSTTTTTTVTKNKNKNNNNKQTKTTTTTATTTNALKYTNKQEQPNWRRWWCGACNCC